MRHRTTWSVFVHGREVQGDINDVSYAHAIADRIRDLDGYTDVKVIEAFEVRGSRILFYESKD